MGLSRLALGRQLQLGPGEAVDELARLAQAQFGADVLAGAGVGCGGHRQARGVREHLGQLAQHAVFGTEVVAPLADAVRLVDGQERDRRARQAVQHPGLHQPLGRDVEEIEPALVDRPPGRLAPVGVGVGIEPRGGDAGLLHPRHLIGHQRDQRRDHQPQTWPYDRGDLVAEALAAPGRQHRQGASPRQHFADDLALVAAEVRMAEHIAQHLAGAVQGGIEGHGGVMPYVDASFETRPGGRSSG